MLLLLKMHITGINKHTDCYSQGLIQGGGGGGLGVYSHPPESLNVDVDET